MTSYSEAISYGGGVNSTAMIIWLYNKGNRDPIIFADTGNEQPETYHYLTYFSKYLKNKFNAEIIILTPPSKYHSKRINETHSKSIEELCLKKGLIPMICFRWCTDEFKRRPIHKFSKENNITWNKIGISYEEKHRAKTKKIGSIRYTYPLASFLVDRDQCIEIIKKEGLQVPIKSGCFFCPYQKLSGWKRLYKIHNGLFERAKKMEENVSKKLKRKVTMRADSFSLLDMEEIWKQENPLFPELTDYSYLECYMCHL